MPGHCHDATPWTQLNRVPLCQATLSIGPYLLLKVQFQHYFVSRTSLALNPTSRSLSKICVLEFGHHSCRSPSEARSRLELPDESLLLQPPLVSVLPGKGELP